MREPLYQLTDLNLLATINKIKMECYDALEAVCEDAKRQLAKLEANGPETSTSQYTITCMDVIAELKTGMEQRREKYVPYIHSLYEKVETNHNCSGCTGNCKLNHDLHFIELQAAHTDIKNILNKLHVVSLPLYSDTKFPEMYRVLRNLMALIESGLTEIFLLEERYLLPKIAEAQKVINAGSR